MDRLSHSYHFHFTTAFMSSNDARKEVNDALINAGGAAVGQMDATGRSSQRKRQANQREREQREREQRERQAAQGGSSVRAHR